MKDFKRSACPELWLRIKCTSLTLSKGQGEAKNPASRVQSSGGGAESCCSACGLKPLVYLIELEACSWVTVTAFKTRASKALSDILGNNCVLAQGTQAWGPVRYFYSFPSVAQGLFPEFTGD